MRFFGIAAFFFVAATGALSAQTCGPLSPSSMPNGTVGVSYSIQITDPDAIMNFSVAWGVISGSLPPGLSLNTSAMGSTTTISGTPTMAGTYNFEVEAEFNSSSPTDNCQMYTIVVSPNCTPTLTPASGPLPPGEINIRYQASVVFNVTGCPGQFTYMVDTDPFEPFPLPSGMSLTQNNLGGTPTQAGTFPFSVTANGPNQLTVSNDYTIVINTAPSITTATPLPTAPVGVLYSQQFAATGGLPAASGYVFSMDNNPPGITMSPSGLLSGTPTQTGSFSFSVGVIDSLGGRATAPFQITFISGTPQIQVTPLSLTFNADFQGNPPLSQAISITPVTGATPPVKFSVTIDNGQSGVAAPTWISVTPSSGTAPAGLVVGVNQGTLAAGTYPARIHVLDSNNLPSDVAVTLNVNSTPQKLTVSPSMLQFAARSASPGTLVENLVVSNTGGGTLAFNTSVTGGSSWISAITPSSGQTTVGAPVMLQVEVNTAGLAIGSYDDSIHIASAAGNADIPISLFVAASGPVLSITPTGIFFHARQNGGTSAMETVEILNTGDPTSTVHWTASLISGSTWLNLVSPSGTATASTPGMLTVAPVQNATQLSPGPYYALVKIADSNSLNSPQYVTLVFNVDPDSVNPAPNPTPGGLFFTTPAGGSAPTAQPIVVNTSSATAIPFLVATTTDSGTWLSATPTSSTAMGQTPGNVSVSVNPTGLAAGIYTGNVNVSIGQTLESVNVTFVVQPTGASGSISRPRPEIACSASKLAMTEVGLVNNFSVPAGWPATLVVQLNNDCGQIVTNGNVTASFSNGDAPLSLAGDSFGNYSATWQPGNVNSQMLVTLNGASGSLAPATAKLYGGIATNQTPPPTLAPGGTLNNLNPVVGGALAPGMIAEVFGTNLAASAGSTGILPLPTNFNKTFAQVGPYQAPLYFLSSGQVNLQIPAEITGTQQVPIVFSVNNALTLPVMLNVVPGGPGVLSKFDGPTPPSVQNNAHIIAQHLDGSAVTTASPGKPGEYLVMYLVGLGATDPAVPSGMAAPSNPLANVTAKPVVTVDSLPSSVYFAGLTPGFVGLYQIDFLVPTGVHTGDVVVTVTQNGIAANPTLLAVSQ
jgi:uncharacterized protein (TIGR03437 family)